MASFDTLGFKQSEGTVLVPRYGMRLRYASNGTVRARALASATRYDPKLVFKGLTLAQLTSLRSFEASNRGVPVSLTFTPTGESFANLLFRDPPFDVEPVQVGAGVVFNVNVYLVQSD